MSRLLTEKEIRDTFGAPDAKGGYLTTIEIPFDLVIAWNTNQKTRKIRCHKLVAPTIKAIFEDIFKTYGAAEIDRLHINRWGGCFMFRQMRNGTLTSRHSWAIAFDIDPLRNGLRTGRAQATLDDKEYDQMRDIIRKHGFLSLGEITGFDWMHFEVGLNWLNNHKKQTPAPQPAPKKAEKVHVVQRGDTLSHIARQHNTTVARLRELNNISGDIIRT